MSSPGCDMNEMFSIIINFFLICLTFHSAFYTGEKSWDRNRIIFSNDSTHFNCM